MLLIQPAYAQESDTNPIAISDTTTTPAMGEPDIGVVPTAPKQDAASMFLPLILIFLIFYFLLIRPQQKRMKAHQSLVNNLKRGDRVVTSGGVVGKISKFTDDNAIVEIETGTTTIQVYKSSISDVLDSKDKKEKKDKK